MSNILQNFCSIIIQIQTIFFVFSINSIEYFISIDNACSNRCVGPLPRIKISFFLLSIFTDELIHYYSKITTFLPVPSLRCDKNTCLSNPTPYPEYLYLSISAFFCRTNCTK